MAFRLLPEQEKPCVLIPTHTPRECGLRDTWPPAEGYHSLTYDGSSSTAWVQSWGHEEHRLQTKPFLTTFNTERIYQVLELDKLRAVVLGAESSLPFSAGLSLQGNSCAASRATHTFVCLFICLQIHLLHLIKVSVTVEKMEQATWPTFSNLYDELHGHTFHSYNKCSSEWLVREAQPLGIPLMLYLRT